MNEGGKPGDVPKFVPADLIEAGRTYLVHHQGRNITPQTITVHVVWVTDTDVHYRVVGDGYRIQQTPIERFREIIGAPKR
jgi:hypothetical protein